MNRCHGLALGIALVSIIGCASKPLAETPPTGPDYSKPLPPGASALRLITDPARMPDLATAVDGSDASLLAAMDQSLVWFAAPSSRNAFPFEGITHERARQSVAAMRELLSSGLATEAVIAQIEARFDIYESVGCDNRGTVLFTGYYSPVFRASRVPTGSFQYPLYRRPPALVTDPASGQPLGWRRPDGSVGPSPTRRELETSSRLSGLELVWMEDPFDAFVVHVNGSAKLRLIEPDGTESGVMYVGYGGKTERPYQGLGASMVAAGLLSRNDLSMTSVKRVYRQRPEVVLDLMRDNDSFVFFTEYDGGAWPAGSLGVRVTPERTIATDKKIYPRGGVVLADTRAITYGGTQRAFGQLMLDQDTGGAIKAPGRADLFMGIGPSAEILAGGQYAEGRLYYFFLKPGSVR